MFEGDGAFPRQPVHGGKDLGPGIIGQQGGEFIKRAGAGPSELLVDRRFDQKFLCHIVPSLTPRNVKSLRLSERNGVAQWTVNE
jgi:hypothetical protein